MIQNSKPFHSGQEGARKKQEGAAQEASSSLDSNLGRTELATQKSHVTKMQHLCSLFQAI
jgi:hypothetical protein